MKQRRFAWTAALLLAALVACSGDDGVPSGSSPSNVTATPGDGYVTVQWEHPGGASRFDVFRAVTGPDGSAASDFRHVHTIEDGSARRYVDVDVRPDRSYAYAISADGSAPVPSGPEGVRPDPGSALRILFASAVPTGATVSIESDPEGIDCAEPGGTRCEARFASVLDVTVAATTSSGIAAVWAGCDRVGSGACTVDMAADRTITVSFEAAYRLTVAVDVPGAGRVTNVNDLGSSPDIACESSCTYSYPPGLLIGLTADPADAENMELADWRGDCVSLGGDVCNVAMDGDRTVAASFRLIPPTVADFHATPDRIGSGETATLAWDVVGGGDLAAEELTIAIEPEVGKVTDRSGAVQVSPSSTTEYTLTASNASGTAVASQRVRVGLLPRITSFAAHPPVLPRGHGATLSWTVAGTDTAASPMELTLEPLGEDVTGLTSYGVAPEETTEYTLVAENALGVDRASVTLRVAGSKRGGSIPPVSTHVRVAAHAPPPAP